MKKRQKPQLRVPRVPRELLSKKRLSSVEKLRAEAILEALEENDIELELWAFEEMIYDNIE